MEQAIPLRDRVLKALSGSLYVFGPEGISFRAFVSGHNGRGNTKEKPEDEPFYTDSQSIKKQSIENEEDEPHQRHHKEKVPDKIV